MVILSGQMKHLKGFVSANTGVSLVLREATFTVHQGDSMEE
jgi:hypothetical protein